MKKKFLLASLAIACAATCIAGLAACNKSPELSELKVALGSVGADYNSEADLGDYVYGETDALESDLANLKFSYGYIDGSTEEASADELGICYKSPDYGDDLSSAIYDELPDNLFSGSWVAYYYVNGHKPTLQSVSSFAVSVNFTVTKSTNGAFTLEMSETQLQFGKTSEVEITVQNANGEEVEEVAMGASLAKTDDTEYSGVNFYYMEKDYYNSLSDAQKKNYEELTTIESDENAANYGYNKAHGNHIDELALTSTDGGASHWGFEGVKPGEYVLLGCIDYTFNYERIVTDGFAFVVDEPESPLGVTFVLKDVNGYYDGGSEVEAGSDIAATIENLKAQNNGKTLICAADGTVTGTFDFGFGALDELTGDAELTISFYADDLSVMIVNRNGISMNGGYSDGELVVSLRIEQSDISYWMTFVFEKQAA